MDFTQKEVELVHLKREVIHKCETQAIKGDHVVVIWW